MSDLRFPPLVPGPAPWPLRENGEGAVAPDWLHAAAAGARAATTVEAGHAARAAVFRLLHAGRTFVAAEVRGPGSAEVLAALGVDALVTRVEQPETGDRLRTVVGGVDLPVAADLGDPVDPAAAVARAAGAGAVGATIDVDAHAGPDLAPVHAAASVARRLPFEFTLTVRFARARAADVERIVCSCRALRAAGADVVEVAGVGYPAALARLAGCAGLPLSVRLDALADGDLARLADLGVTRIVLPARAAARSACRMPLGTDWETR